MGAEDIDSIREMVRQRYASAACCGDEVGIRDTSGTKVFGAALYEGEAVSAPGIQASLGCGNPTAIADLHEGETILGLGSGGGGDVLLSARRVGPTGRAIGVDMTDEMPDAARANAARAGLENVEFIQGRIEAIPVSDVVADACMDDVTRADMQQWTGCITGALKRAQFAASLAQAGLVDVDIRETHRVHEQAASAIVRAVKPAA